VRTLEIGGIRGNQIGVIRITAHNRAILVLPPP
jgi:hypothetical protein